MSVSIAASTSSLNNINVTYMPLIASDINITVTLEKYSGPDKYFHESWILDNLSHLSSSDDTEIIDILSKPNMQQMAPQIGIKKRTTYRKTKKDENKDKEQDEYADSLAFMKKQKIMHDNKIEQSASFFDTELNN